MPRGKTVLFATDLSEPAQRAFAAARGLCHGPDGRLILLHVLRPARRSVQVGRSVISVPAGTRHQGAREALRALTGAIPGVEIERLVIEGHAVEQILRVAQEYRCDWIVMGSRGACDSEDRPLGSVTGEVLRRSRCPVVIVGAAGSAVSDGTTSTGHRQCAAVPG